MLITKKQVTQLSYDITGLAIKVHKNLAPGCWKASMKPASNMNWKEMVIQ